MTVAIADSVDASPQTSIKSWICGDVKKWLNDVGLENRSASELQNSFFFTYSSGPDEFVASLLVRLQSKKLSLNESWNEWNPGFLYSRICTKELGLHVLSKANYEKSDK